MIQYLKVKSRKWKSTSNNKDMKNAITFSICCCFVFVLCLYKILNNKSYFHCAFYVFLFFAHATCNWNPDFFPQFQIEKTLTTFCPVLNCCNFIYPFRIRWTSSKSLRLHNLRAIFFSFAKGARGKKNFKRNQMHGIKNTLNWVYGVRVHDFNSYNA